MIAADPDHFLDHHLAGQIKVEGAQGTVGELFDVMENWRPKAVDICGRALPCGHSPQEEIPDLFCSPSWTTFSPPPDGGSAWGKDDRVASAENWSQNTVKLYRYERIFDAKDLFRRVTAR